VARGKLRILVAALSLLQIGLVMAPTRVTAYPQATLCEGGASYSGGPLPGLSAYLVCGSHSVSFDGTGASELNLCPDGPSVTAAFTGTESVDYGPGVAASWVLTGRQGLYLLRARSESGIRGAGVFTTLNNASFCYPPYVSGPVVMARASLSGPAPDAFVCQASGTVNSITVSGGRAGSSAYGSAQGSGSCRSTQGTWALAYTGQWGEPALPSCGPDSYFLALQLTGKSTGRALTTEQAWVLERRGAFVVNQVGLTPIGAGHIAEDPMPCPIPSSLTTQERWAFVLA
jgi:hypothetical protein